MRQLTEAEHERLLSIERAYRKLRNERRPYVMLRRWAKSFLISLGRTEPEAERTIVDEVEARSSPLPDAYLLRKPENEDAGSLH